MALRAGQGTQAAVALVHRVGWQADLIRRNRWFWPLTRAASRFEQHTDWPLLPELDALYADMTAGCDVTPLRFAQNVRKRDKRVAGRVNLDALYDARISKHGEVPSRERDWHDFFNALCFATFPRSKIALHTRQYAILEQRVGHDAQRLPGARTREQDALTLFDEGGVVIAADERGYETLMNASPEVRRARLLEITTRSHEATASPIEQLSSNGSDGCVALVPFGHALFEHLIEALRCPAGCTQLMLLPSLSSDRDRLLQDVDRALATALSDAQRFLSPRDGAQTIVSLR